MYPVSDSEWQFTKNEPVEETPAIGNVSRSWQWRERGIDPPNYPPNKKVFENIAEDILVQKPLHIRSCDLPGSPRSTFLMVFSPDGTKVASTHGNHNVYVSELASGKHVRILKGHPRTPWCIAFHPSHPQLIGSGCLGGQVRVWDIASGGSEVWNVRNETVIASIAFHPREQLLVIATYNELYFWDWSNPTPFTKVSTNNVNEKVRYVAFDSLGYKLITGISLWTCPPTANSVPLATMNSNSSGPSSNGGNSNGNSGNGNSGNGNGGNGNGGSGGGGGNDSAGGSGDGGDAPGSSRPPESPGAAQDMIVNSYQTLVQRYDSLVRNYQRLFMVRHRLTSTPPPPNTIDRGTDPMETYPLDLGRRRRAVRWRLSRTATNTTSSDNSNPTPSTSRGRTDAGDSGDGESTSSRFLNLDVLSFDSDASRNQDSPTQERSPFGSRSSAFQPLNESERTFRTVDQNERARLLPNPFSSRAGASPLRAGVPLSRSHRLLLERTDPSADLPASRTSIFTSSREPDVAQDLTVRLPVRRRNVAAQSTPRAAAASAPATANSSTQMTPDMEDADARAINESLDLIRDILRDSGTRLLNLITDMSANLMAGRRDEIERDARRRPDMRSLTRELLHSSSEDEAERDSVRRARDAAFRELPGDRAASDPPADRLLVELEDAALGGGGFRVRTHSAAPEDPPPRRPLARFDPDAPSTSRDDFWSRGSDLPSVEAFRRVRTGVCALNRHTAELARAWLRGERYNPAQLRTSWENLRRRVLALQRDAGRQDSPGYYTRSLLDRCRLLTEMVRPARAEPRPADAPAEPSTDTASGAESPAATTAAAGARPPRPAILRSPRASISLRPLALRRRASNGRWQSAGEPGARRPRVQRPPRPSRREFARTFEMTATRHEIRMRAMQVLSVMFNMMMMCLGEDGLNYLIVHMLKALKKSLALSCFMMMSKRNAPPRRTAAAGPPSRDTESADVVRIQNAEHAGPVNVDGPDEPGSPRADDGTETAARVRSPAAAPPPVAAPTAARAPPRRASDSDERRSPPAAGGARWSRRLAVQIAVANRNDSTTARTRREMYLEGRRQKALHRTDPAAHPLVKRRFPPVMNHRIPALRRLPRAPARSSPRRASQSDEPAAGPSGIPPRSSAMAIDNRDLLRIAQLQAVRLRNAARNRFRRLQTIRLYTPSSVFALQSSGGESPQEGGAGAGAGAAPAGGAEGRRTFAGGWGAAGARAPDAGQFHAVLNNVAMPLMQVNDLPPADAPHQAQRMPRIHEYLQPIILAQNAMVVEDEAEGGGGNGGGIGRRMGGMAGLLDAGIISEALPAPSNRVQAWDFTSGQPPYIADSSRNVVVQRCRIHNDASIDISKDGRLLVALLPGTRLRNTNSWLGVYSLEWSRLGQCLHTAMLEQSAVSVALSPTARYLAVGLGSRRFTSAPHARNNIIALLYKLDPLENSSRTGLSPIKELMQHWEHGFTSLNCLRWAPQPGQGLVYANNTGQLIIMS